jgi:flagellar basal body-associated protein FliL
MIKKLLPILIALIGAGAGVGAGIALRPAPEPLTAEEAEAAAKAAAEEIAPEDMPEYVKLNNQFVVPVVKDGKVAAMVILALSLEAKAGSTQEIYAREPKLRDEFLQILFEHANAGGFDGSFTDGDNLVLLRKSFLESAQKVFGENVTDVLINDIARQDSR